MRESDWLEGTSPAFRLTIATSWLAPDALREHQEKAIGEAVADGPDWAEYLRLVDRHMVPVTSWILLGQIPRIAVPEPVKQHLRKLSDACRIRAVGQCANLVNVLRSFNRAGIAAMPLKGQVLSSQLYEDVGFRQSSDLDIAVAEEDTERARGCLLSTGWQLDPALHGLNSRQWDSLFRHEHDISFVHPLTGCNLELHWRNHWETPDATRSLWARSTQSVWRDCLIRVMSPSDLTLYLCRHGGEHAWNCAKWVGDLARAHCTKLLEWNLAMEEARKYHQENTMLTGMCLLNTLYKFPQSEFPSIPQQTKLSPLIKIPLCAIGEPDEQPVRTGLKSLRNNLRKRIYVNRLWSGRPLKDRLSEIFYSREDFKMLPLPESLFWLYTPLRPVLWFWRWVRQNRTEHSEEVAGQLSNRLT